MSAPRRSQPLWRKQIQRIQAKELFRREGRRHPATNQEKERGVKMLEIPRLLRYRHTTAGKKVVATPNGRFEFAFHPFPKPWDTLTPSQRTQYETQFVRLAKLEMRRERVLPRGSTQWQDILRYKRSWSRQWASRIREEIRRREESVDPVVNDYALLRELHRLAEGWDNLRQALTIVLDRHPVKE